MSRQQEEIQNRAKFAHHAIQHVKDNVYGKDYGSLARRFPSLILTDGIASALAFLKAKMPKKEQHKVLYGHINTWIMQEKIKPKTDHKDLLNWLIEEATTNDYRQVTTEVLAYAGWLKRFVEAHNLGDATDSGDD